MKNKDVKDEWLKLDNAAKIYPAFASKKDPATFRVAAVLKRDVIVECLQRALDETIVEFPSMALTLKKGLFWAYLEENQKMPKVIEETKMPCTYIDLNRSNGYLFYVYYYRKRISFECFHALTDGYGALEFLKALLYNYLKQIYTIEPEQLRLHGHTTENMEDSYKKYSKKMDNKTRSVLASHIKGTPTRIEGSFVHHGIISASGLKSISKQYNSTITVLLASVYLKSLIQVRRKGPIVVTVPINLRKIFPSQTLRNFSYFMNIVAYDDLPLDEMITSVDEQFKSQMKPEALQGQFSKNVSFEEQFFLRMMPNIIKSFFLKQARAFKSKKIVTSILTNTGIVTLPKSMKEHVTHFETILYASKPHYINMGISTYEDQLVITLSRGIEEKDIIEKFFSNLVEVSKLPIMRYSNEGE